MKQARTVAGYSSAEAFAASASIGPRSVQLVEAGSEKVGPRVLIRVGAALAKHFSGWSVNTPKLILDGGPIPDLDTVDSQKSAQRPLDVVWPEALKDFKVLLDSDATAYAMGEKIDDWRGPFHRSGRTDTDLLDVIKEAWKVTRDKKKSGG